jgi:hypothetical protein
VVKEYVERIIEDRKEHDGWPRDSTCKHCGKEIRMWWLAYPWRHWQGYKQCEDKQHNAEPKEAL